MAVKFWILFFVLFLGRFFPLGFDAGYPSNPPHLEGGGETSLSANFFAVDGAADVASVEQDLLRALRPSSVA